MLRDCLYVCRADHKRVVPTFALAVMLLAILVEQQLTQIVRVTVTCQQMDATG
jgi:hypothetical protein